MLHYLSIIKVLSLRIDTVCLILLLHCMSEASSYLWTQNCPDPAHHSLLWLLICVGNLNTIGLEIHITWDQQLSPLYDQENNFHLLAGLLLPETFFLIKLEQELCWSFNHPGITKMLAVYANEQCQSPSLFFCWQRSIETCNLAVCTFCKCTSTDTKSIVGSSEGRLTDPSSNRLN